MSAQIIPYRVRTARVSSHVRTLPAPDPIYFEKHRQLFNEVNDPITRMLEEALRLAFEDEA